MASAGRWAGFAGLILGKALVTGGSSRSTGDSPGFCSGSGTCAGAAPAGVVVLAGLAVPGVGAASPTAVGRVVGAKA
jgi:hypothetical protein